MEKNLNEETIKKHFQLFESLEPLKYPQSRKAVGRFKAVIHHHLLELNTVDAELFAELCDLLMEPSSYELPSDEEERLLTSIRNLIDLIEKTSPLPYFRITSLSDILDESRVNLYPVFALKPETRDLLDELCKVVMEMNQSSDHYVCTHVTGMCLAWELDPMKGRWHKDFLRLNPDDE